MTRELKTRNYYILPKIAIFTRLLIVLYIYILHLFYVYISFILLNRKDLDNCRTSRVKLRIFLSKIAIFGLVFDRKVLIFMSFKTTLFECNGISNLKFVSKQIRSVLKYFYTLQQ